jgi:hypothetical protein
MAKKNVEVNESRTVFEYKPKTGTGFIMKRHGSGVDLSIMRGNKPVQVTALDADMVENMKIAFAKL